MTWNIRFFTKKDDIKETFERTMQENDSQFTDDEAVYQANLAYNAAFQMIYKAGILGKDVEEVEVSLGGHANPDRVPGFALPFVSISVRGIKYPEPEPETEPVQEAKPPTE